MLLHCLTQPWKFVCTFWVMGSCQRGLSEKTLPCGALNPYADKIRSLVISSRWSWWGCASCCCTRKWGDCSHFSRYGSASKWAWRWIAWNVWNQCQSHCQSCPRVKRVTRDKEYTQWPLTKFVQLHISYNCCFVSVFFGGAEIAFVHRVRCNKLTVVGCLVNVFSFSRNLLGFTVCHRKYYLCFFLFFKDRKRISGGFSIWEFKIDEIHFEDSSYAFRVWFEFYVFLLATLVSFHYLIKILTCILHWRHTEFLAC